MRRSERTGKSSMLDIEDRAQLISYLSERVGDRSLVEGLRPVRVEGGVSNRTVRVDFPDGRSWVLKQATEKLRVDDDWYCSPNRSHREALGLEVFGKLLSRGSVPVFLFEDRDSHLVAMESVSAPFYPWHGLLLDGAPKMEDVRRCAALLADVHVTSRLTRADLPVETSDHSFFWNLRLEPLYRFTADAVAGAKSFLIGLVESYGKHRTAIVHGGFGPANLLFHGGRPVLVDFETMHFGDPAFDAGYALAHLLGYASRPAADAGRFLHAAEMFWRTYLRATTTRVRKEWGGDFEARVSAHAAACSLGRAAGRLPFDYLSRRNLQRQRSVIETMMPMPPTTVSGFLDAFAAGLSSETGDPVL